MCDVIFEKVAKSLHLGGYLIGKFQRAFPKVPLLTDDQISVGNSSGTDTMSSPLELAMILSNHVFSGLSHFLIVGGSLSRNSYRSLLCHIYELVKLGSN